MFNTNAGTLPVSIPLNVGGNGGVFGNGNGFDDIIALAVVAMIFGWNGNGYGGFGGCGGGQGGGYVSDNYALITDNATLERKIDGVYSGICDSTFALNNTITNGFASAQNTMTQGFAGLNTAIVTSGYETRNAVTQDTIGNMQNTNLLQGAIKDCCCQTQQNIKDTQYAIGSTGAEISRGVERGFADTNYNLATQANMLDRTIADKFCQTNFNAQTNTRDIIDSQNAGFRMLSDKIDSVVNNQKDAKIAEQACIINNQYLLSQINKTAVPAYIVQNPNCGCNPTVYGTTIA